MPALGASRTRRQTGASLPAWRLWPYALVALFVVGCLGDQFGGMTNDGDGPQCVLHSRTEISRQQQSALGFSGADVMAFAERSHTQELLWGDASAQSEGVTMVPEAGPSQLSISIDTAQATYWFADYEFSEQSAPNQVEGFSCPDALEVDTWVLVESANGAFQESTQLTLSAQQPLLVTAALALRPGEMTGSFDLSVDAPATLAGEEVLETKLIGPELWFALTPGGMLSGLIATGIETRTESAVSFGGALLGRFPPANPCQALAGKATALAPESAPAAAVSELLTEVSLVQFSWQDTGKNDRLAFELEAGPYCLQMLDAFSTVRRGMSFQVDAERADDQGGELRAWSFQAQAEADATGQVSLVHLQLQPSEEQPVAQFLADTGLSGLSLSPFDEARMSLELSWTPAGGWQGTAAVEARTNDDPCNPDGSGVPVEYLGPECAHWGWSSVDTARLTLASSAPEPL